MSESPLAALKRLLAAGAALALTRAELAQAELAQARLQWQRSLLWFAAAVLCALLALLAATMLVVALLWPALGIWSLALPVVCYGLAAALLLRHVQQQMALAPPVLGVTLAELQRDRESLTAAVTRQEPQA
jgi:uncharacterized membrane protein YqjE